MSLPLKILSDGQSQEIEQGREIETVVTSRMSVAYDLTVFFNYQNQMLVIL